MRSTTILAGVTALTIALAAAAPAYAVCMLCNATVRLDSGLASCFADRADDELKKLTDSGKQFIIVDLSDCKSRGGLPTATADGAALALDKQFVADADAIKCLSADIGSATDATLDPSHLFDLTKDCPAQ